MILRKITYLFAFLFCVACDSEKPLQPPVQYGDVQDYPKETFTVFPISSEVQIGKAKHLIEKAPDGWYVTVGSERAFRGASMMPNIQGLYILDFSEAIVRFNLINRELLKVPERLVYRRLRDKASYEEWAQKVPGLTQDDWNWWQEHVRREDPRSYLMPQYLNRYEKAPPCKDEYVKSEYERSLPLGRILDYKTGNYLFEDEGYERLHKLAVTNRILVSRIDFSSQKHMEQLTTFLKKHHVTIGLLDMDNLYLKEFIGQGAYHRLIHALKPFGMDQSVLLVMSNHLQLYACYQWQNYIGFRFKHIESWPKNFIMQDFWQTMSPEVHNLINGRLYEPGDALPVFGGKK